MQRKTENKREKQKTKNISIQQRKINFQPPKIEKRVQKAFRLFVYNVKSHL